MSSPISSIVSVAISQQTQAVQQASFSIPACEGPSNRFAAALTTTGNTVSGSNQLSALGSVSGLGIGQLIAGVGIPLYTYILNITGSIITMSRNATATATGISVTFKDYSRTYTTLAGMVADGFETSDPEYIHAREFLEQPLQPEQFVIIEGFAPVEQQDTFSVNSLDTSHLYTFTLNGQLVSYQATGGNAKETVLNGLLTAIDNLSAPAVSGGVSGTGNTALLTLISLIPGAGVSYTAIDTKLTQTNTVLNHSVADDVANSRIQNDTWYGLTICSQVADDIEQVAAYIEAELKIFGGDSNDAAILTSSTSDVASILKGLAYKRTFSMYAGTPNDARAAAWLGGQLPQVPGSSNWKFKTLVGVSPDNLTANQIQTCIGIPGTPGKNCNIYQTVGGVNITQEGFMAGGQFIDLTVGIDWLTSEIQTNTYSQLVNSPKIPYTEAGIAVIENGIWQALRQGVTNGLIDGASAITVTAPAIGDISANNKALRVLTGVKFTCRLAGALNFIQINGVVTV